MLDYAVKLTLTPWKVGEGDVERLREVGFDPAAVLDICQVASSTTTSIAWPMAWVSSSRPAGGEGTTLSLGPNLKSAEGAATGSGSRYAGLWRLCAGRVAEV